MLLYLKTLGASGTVLGITVAMLPLFAVLQIPAANFVEKIGYKNFVVRGWASRSIFILGIAIAALLPDSVEPRLRITLILIMLACFAAARGISMCGYLPWITNLVPVPLRGAFISRDSTCMYVAVTATMLLCSVWVKCFPSSRLFGLLFLFSYMAALVSLFFLRRIPDSQTKAARTRTSHPPWRQMLVYPPFFRYIAFTVFMNLFLAALGVIWVPYMRDSYRASGSLILGISAYSNILAAVFAMFAGRMADRFGSRPLLSIASGFIIAGQCLWMALASGAIARNTLILYGITSFGAGGVGMLTVASSRLLMGLVPVIGRSHFFAISSVATSLSMGVLPILWGLALDTLQKLIPEGIPLVNGWTWNAYSLLYAAIVIGLLISRFLLHRLDEPRALSTEEFLRLLLIQSPAKLISRVLNPLRRSLPPT